ncbi:HET-domain-containing protein [Setomelanomma holmii]|uniref:HET-domain-containing protein n=1 Tax=Setomelanomma holmii TaxID=210430 RepID=A0A9P4LRH6_9PLEO|nr:HET-domain-containing protein [Setomelanomma holmii]
MRLLAYKDDQFSFTKDIVVKDEVPPYAILSHTWRDGEEVTFDEMVNCAATNKSGYEKIRFCARQARRNNLDYYWVDTCCINKTDPVELQDAINSMFRWYRDAVRCYVYLQDVVSGSDWEPAFRKSRWFTRGWTLQELLAPNCVEFFTRDGELIGDKRTLERQIHEITGIPLAALRSTPMSEFSVEDRLSWGKNRQTTRPEDKVYSLLGFFGIYMPMIYGETEEHALWRLKTEIVQRQVMQQHALLLTGGAHSRPVKDSKDTVHG